MAGPKGPEQGIRSPLRRRAGIDFPQWEGVNRQNDPGAIRDTQFQNLINVRLAGNEISSRGGQEAVINTGLDGCVYGMIDIIAQEGFYVQSMSVENAGNLSIWDPLTQSLTTALDPVLGLFDPTELTAGYIGAGNIDDFPRLGILPLRGHLYITGTDTDTSKTGIFDTSYDAETKTVTVSLVQEVSDLCSWTVVNEAGEDVAYLGTIDGTVYRWDGISFVEEASALSATRLIMFNYAGDIYAAGTDLLLKRGNATWTTSFAMPGGITTFRPVAALEFGNVALIAGSDAGAAKVLSFNGTTLSTSYAPAGDIEATDLATGGGKAFFSYLDPSNDITIAQFDGSTWSVFDTETSNTDVHPGCLRVVGNTLYFWTRGTDSGSTDRVMFISYPDFLQANKTDLLAGAISEQTPPYDMALL